MVDRIEQDAARGVDLVVGDRQRRCDAQRRGPEEEPFGEQARLHGALYDPLAERRVAEFDGHQQSGAAHLFYGRVRAHRLFIAGSFRIGLLHQSFAEQVFERRESRRAADRVSAEGGDVPQHRVGLERRHDPVRRDECAQRHAAAEGFCGAEDVWGDSRLLEVVERAGAARAGLDFVEDQQSSGFVAAAPQRFEETGCGQLDTPFALHRLDDDAGRAGGDLFQVFGTVEPQLLHVGQQRTVRIAVLLPAHYAQRAVRAAVVGVFKRDQFGAARVAFGQLERPFDRFAARIDEVDRLQSGRQQFGDAGGIANLRRLDHLAVDHQVQVVARLRADRFDDRRVVVADVADRDARDQVDPLFAVRAEQPHAFGALDLEAHREIGSLSDVFEKELSEVRFHRIGRLYRRVVSGCRNRLLCLFALPWGVRSGRIPGCVRAAGVPGDGAFGGRRGRKNKRVRNVRGVCPGVSGTAVIVRVRC